MGLHLGSEYPCHRPRTVVYREHDAVSARFLMQHAKTSPVVYAAHRLVEQIYGGLSAQRRYTNGRSYHGPGRRLDEVRARR